MTPRIAQSRIMRLACAVVAFALRGVLCAPTGAPTSAPSAPPSVGTGVVAALECFYTFEPTSTTIRDRSGNNRTAVCSSQCPIDYDIATNLDPSPFNQLYVIAFSPAWTQFCTGRARRDPYSAQTLSFWYLLAPTISRDRPVTFTEATGTSRGLAVGFRATFKNYACIPPGCFHYTYIYNVDLLLTLDWTNTTAVTKRVRLPTVSIGSPTRPMFHLALVFEYPTTSALQYTVYVDGVLIELGTIAVGSYTDTGRFPINQGADCTSVPQPTLGSDDSIIDDLRVFSKALTKQEVDWVRYQDQYVQPLLDAPTEAPTAAPTTTASVECPQAIQAGTALDTAEARQTPRSPTRRAVVPVVPSSTPAIAGGTAAVPCTRRACHCTVGQYVFSYVYRADRVGSPHTVSVLRASAASSGIVNGTVAFVAITADSADERTTVACAANGQSVVVVLAQSALLVQVLTGATGADGTPFTWRVAASTLDNPQNTQVSDFVGHRATAMFPTMHTLVNLDVGTSLVAAGLTDANELLLLSRISLQDSQFTSIAGLGAVPFSVGYTLLARKFALPEALRTRSFAGAALSASFVGSDSTAGGGAVAILYAQTNVTAETMSTSNDDMVTLFLHTDVPATYRSAVIARAASPPDGLALYASFTNGTTALANAWLFRRTSRWPHYYPADGDPTLASLRVDLVRRVVFSSGPLDASTRMLRAYVVSVPADGVRVRVPFRDTAPLVWQCVFAFGRGVELDGNEVMGTYPDMQCQTGMPFMAGATELMTATSNLVEAFSPRAMTTGVATGAQRIDLVVFSPRIGPLGFVTGAYTSICNAPFTGYEVVQHFLVISVPEAADWVQSANISASVARANAGGHLWTPQAPADFAVAARANYTNRENYLGASSDPLARWNLSAAFERHTYDISTGIFAVSSAPVYLCADEPVPHDDMDASVPSAVALRVGAVRHADSTTDGFLVLATAAAGTRLSRLVPSGTPVLAEIRGAEAGVVGTARGDLVYTFTSAWGADETSAPQNADALRVRFSNVAPAVDALAVDLVRVGDTRPVVHRFTVSLGTESECRRAPHALNLDLRALGRAGWLFDGLYSVRLSEVYGLASASSPVSGTVVASEIYAVSEGTAPSASAAQPVRSEDVGMQFLAVRAVAALEDSPIDADTEAPLYNAASTTGDVDWANALLGTAPVDINTTLVPESIHISALGDALWALTWTHLVRLSQPMNPAGFAAQNWDDVAVALPSWCTQGAWDSVALDASLGAYAVACTWDPLGLPTTGATTTPPGGWPHGSTPTALYVYTLADPGTVSLSGGAWRSRALRQGAALHAAYGTPANAPRWGRVHLLAVDGGFAEMMHWYGSDPYTFGTTHLGASAGAGALYTLLSGDSDAVESVRAQDEWRVDGAARSVCTRAAFGVNATCGAVPSLLYPLPATHYVSGASNLAAQTIFPNPDVIAPRQRQEVRWSLDAPLAAGSPDGKRVAVFFPRGDTAVVCAHEVADPRGVATMLGLYTNGPCRQTSPLVLDPANQADDPRAFAEAQLIVTPSVAVILVVQDDGFAVRLRTMVVDRDLAVFAMSAVEFTTTWPGARRALVYQSLGIVTFADVAVRFDAISGRLLAGSVTTLDASEAIRAPASVAWASLAVSERALLVYKPSAGTLGVLPTRVRNVTDSAWAAPGTSNRTFLACAGADTLTSACYTTGLGSVGGVPRLTEFSPSALATDVYPSGETADRLAPVFVRPWAGADDWYRAYPGVPVAATAVPDTRAPWFHAETRYRRCATDGTERPRRYTGDPDVWTCYWDADAAVAASRTAPHPNVGAVDTSCGGEYTAVRSVDLPPQDGRWDITRTSCHEHLRAPCTNASANVHCVVYDGVEVSVGRFTDADVFPVPYRFAELEAIGVAPTARLRMCRGTELLNACLMDERACLAVDTTATLDTPPSSAGPPGGAVVAVSCDADFWAAYTPEETAMQPVAWWRERIAAGNLTWLTPANLRTSYGFGAPLHAGNLAQNFDTIPLDLGLAAINPTVVFGPQVAACSTTEAACPATGRAADACFVHEFRSRTTGRFVFRAPLARVCAPDPLPRIVTVRRASLTDTQARSLCGPCWAPGVGFTATPRPVATTWDPDTDEPLTVDSSTCVCPSCAPAWNDSRVCVAPNRPPCSTSPLSFVYAARLCGPGALGCTYECSSASTAAPVCKAFNCTCAYPDPSPGAPLPCRAPPQACDTATRVTRCGPYAAGCDVHYEGAANLAVYTCYAAGTAAGSLVATDPSTGLMLAPPDAHPSFGVPVGQSGLLDYGSANGSSPALPDADRDPALRGLAHWDCGWTAAYLRSQGTVTRTGAPRGFTGYTQAYAARFEIDSFALRSRCLGADGTLGTGLLLLIPTGTLPTTHAPTPHSGIFVFTRYG